MRTDNRGHHKWRPYDGMARIFDIVKQVFVGCAFMRTWMLQRLRDSRAQLLG